MNDVSAALRESSTKKYDEGVEGEPLDIIFASDCDLWCVGKADPFRALLLRAYIDVRAANGGELGADWLHGAPPESTAADGNVRVDDDNKTWFAAPFVRYVCQYGDLSVPPNISNVGFRNAGQSVGDAPGSSAFFFFFPFPPHHHLCKKAGALIV